MNNNMLVRKAFRTSTCLNCRVSLLREFTQLANSTGQTPPWFLRPNSRIVYRQTRNLSSSTTNSPVTHPRPSDDSPTNAVVDDELSGNDDSTDLEVHEENIPWYLQAETTTKTPEFLLERQRIPELPEHPPPILEPLLQQLSIDLGLDYLTILDLRKLEPPPALGANLLMIIGTARSEKHLHTSADRLCRWLRSTHKLRPDADGLLGRDERKLKMKRKARRAKLLGSGMDDDGDDGIRTGWICVDVGVVEKAPEAEETAKQPDFVGFGQRSVGIKLVVQMLTEEKREEIDLESLWNGILKRSKDPELQQQEQQELAAAAAAAEEVESKTSKS